MKKKILKIAMYTMLVCIIIFVLVVFLPRSYDAAKLKQRPGTQYWNLRSGSRIAYTLISATGIKRPFPVIFLQGGPGGPIFDRNIKALAPLSAAGYDIYLYDQLGCGFSQRLTNIEGYTADRHKRDLEEIVKIIGTGKVILIGQSWGAILATLFIADNPTLVDKVVFTGPGPIFPLNKELAQIEAPDSLQLRKPASTNAEAIQKASNIRTNLVKYLAETFGIKFATDNEMDNYQTYQEGFNRATVCDPSKAPEAEAGSGFYCQVMTIHSLSEVKDPRPRLKGVKTPVLLMKGQCDNQKWGYITEYLKLFQNHKLYIIPDAGHSISIEQPDLYLKTIRDFLLDNKINVFDFHTKQTKS